MAHYRKRQGSNWIRRDKRWAIYIRDRFVCVWCGGTEGGLTLDHIFVTGSRFRDNHARRIVTACFTCNRRRGQVRLSAWLRFMLVRGAAVRLQHSRATPLNLQAARKDRESLWAPLAVGGALW